MNKTEIVPEPPRKGLVVPKSTMGPFGLIFDCPLPYDRKDQYDGNQKSPSLMYPPKCICFSRLSSACHRTPECTEYIRIVPWDHNLKDYAYWEVHDVVFRGRYSFEALKKTLALAREKQSEFDFWDPLTSYFYAVIILLTLMVVSLLICVLLTIILTGMYYILLWITILIIFLIILGIALIWLRMNNLTTIRHSVIESVCTSINRKYLKSSGVALYPGDFGAWIAVYLDKRRTNLINERPSPIPIIRQFSEKPKEGVKAPISQFPPPQKPKLAESRVVDFMDMLGVRAEDGRFLLREEINIAPMNTN